MIFDWIACRLGWHQHELDRVSGYKLLDTLETVLTVKDGRPWMDLVTIPKRYYGSPCIGWSCLNCGKDMCKPGEREALIEKLTASGWTLLIPR